VGRRRRIPGNEQEEIDISTNDEQGFAEREQEKIEKTFCDACRNGPKDAGDSITFLGLD